jgi:hypothetical protein
MLQLPSLFADSMVLQRNAAISVWGEATPGVTVSVRLASPFRTDDWSWDERFLYVAFLEWCKEGRDWNTGTMPSPEANGGFQPYHRPHRFGVLRLCGGET